MHYCVAKLSLAQNVGETARSFYKNCVVVIILFERVKLLHLDAHSEVINVIMFVGTVMKQRCTLSFNGEKAMANLEGFLH